MIEIIHINLILWIFFRAESSRKVDVREMSLIPELCRVVPLPRSLVEQAYLLPSILQRVNRLLISNEIRVEINKAIGLNPAETHPPKGRIHEHTCPWEEGEN